MSKRKKSGNFSYKGGVSLDFYGFEELLQKIVNAGGNLETALTRSLVASSKPIEHDLLNYMEKHRLTGKTIESFQNVYDVDRIGGYIRYKLGFDIKQGGLPALFLDLGTPKIKPSFFVYYAFMNNADNVKKEQEIALREVFKELL